MWYECAFHSTPVRPSACLMMVESDLPAGHHSSLRFFSLSPHSLFDRAHTTPIHNAMPAHALVGMPITARPDPLPRRPGGRGQVAVAGACVCALLKRRGDAAAVCCPLSHSLSLSLEGAGVAAAAPACA